MWFEKNHFVLPTFLNFEFGLNFNAKILREIPKVMISLKLKYALKCFLNIFNKILGNCCSFLMSYFEIKCSFMAFGCFKARFF